MKAETLLTENSQWHRLLAPGRDRGWAHVQQRLQGS